MVLDTDLILNTAIDYGYLKAAKNIDMVEGYYDNIQSIGGELSVSTLNQTVNIDSDIEFLNEMVIINGTLGQPLSTINKLTASGVNVLPHKTYALEMQTNNDLLILNRPIKIVDRSGLVLTGSGSKGNIGIYLNENEIESDTNLFWDFNDLQLQVGDQSQSNEFIMVIEKGLQTGGPLIINEKEFDYNETISISDLASVAFSGAYDDLINTPNLDIYTLEAELEATLKCKLLLKSFHKHLIRGLW